MDCLENQDSKPNMVNEDDEAWIHSSVMSISFVLPMVLNAILELNVLEIIDEAPAQEVSATYIVSKLPQITSSSNRHGSSSSALDRMLRLLASHSLLSCSTRKLENGGFERLYGVTKAGKFFIQTKDGSLASMSFLSGFHAVAEDTRCYLKDAVLEGAIPFKKAHNMSMYEYMQKDPELSECFDKAMSEHSSIIVNQILELYNGFEGLTSLVDVGGGSGTTLHIIISKYPSIRGINFDLPRLSNNAPSYQGMENVEGDMFKGVPNGSAILLKWILHNWSDEDCLRILKNCYEALSDTGKVIVVEMVIPEMVETSPLAKYTSQYDNIMLMNFGAKERSEEEFKALAMATGFSGFKVACHVYGHCVMEFHK